MSNEGPQYKKLSVLMPIYNERWTLNEIVQRVLRSPVALEIELVAVDDCSRDGSWELLQQMAAEDGRIKPFRHPQNRGKGAAIRTAIEHLTGDVAVVQDADLEYDPNDYPLLLAPIVEGKADAVFGSRFTSHKRRVLFFWHFVINNFLTLVSNVLNDLNLTDMETCYKVVRADILKHLRLKADTFTLEPELTCRLAQSRARIYEVPVSYTGRTYDEGKKIRASDGVKALWQMFQSKFIDPQFTDHAGLYALTVLSKAGKRNRWLLRQVEAYLGQRLLEAGAGIGNLSAMLLSREHLLLVDREPLYVSTLQNRFRLQKTVTVEQADLAAAEVVERWRGERLDTILSVNLLEHFPADEQVLRNFHEILTPGGHCIVVVPAGPRLYTKLDKHAGHERRYSAAELRQKLVASGFEVVHSQAFCRAGSIAWTIEGRLLRRRRLWPREMLLADRCWALTRALDHVLPVPASSLLMVGRKTGK